MIDCINVIDLFLVYNIKGKSRPIIEEEIFDICNITNPGYDKCSFDKLIRLKEEAFIVYISEITTGDIYIYHINGDEAVLEKHIKLGATTLRICEGCPSGQKDCVKLLHEVYVLTGLEYLKEEICFREDANLIRHHQSLYNNITSVFIPYRLEYEIDIYHDLANLYQNNYAECMYYNQEVEDIYNRLLLQFKIYSVEHDEYTFDAESIFNYNIRTFFDLLYEYNMPCLHLKTNWVGKLDSALPRDEGEESLAKFEWVKEKFKLTQENVKLLDYKGKNNANT